MKILIALLSVGFAGTERHAIELANALAQRCEVALLLRARPAEPHRQAGYRALRDLVAPGIPTYEASRAMPVFGLWRALARFRPDLIHAHHERSARITSRWAVGVPVAATVHVRYRARDFMRCAGLICLTEEEAARVSAEYSGICEVIPNWVLPHPSPAPARLAALRTEFGLRAEDFVVGSVARLEPVKGLAGLIEAFARADLPNARLVIVGDGSQRSDLERLAARVGAAGRIVFTGFRADARDLMSLFDLFVLNSDDEPYGLAILEAAGAGVPVIAAASRGPRAIAASIPIHLVPPGAAEALTDALRQGFSRRIPAASVAGHRMEDRLPDLLAFYARVAARRRPVRARMQAAQGSSSHGHTPTA